MIELTVIAPIKDGGVTSAGSKSVTAVLSGGELTFPAASRARTRTWSVLPGTRPAMFAVSELPTLLQLAAPSRLSS